MQTLPHRSTAHATAERPSCDPVREVVGDEPRCPVCKARLPRHYPPCRPTRLELIAPVVWALFIVPIVVFVVGLTRQTAAYVATVGACWLFTYFAARHW